MAPARRPARSSRHGEAAPARSPAHLLFLIRGQAQELAELAAQLAEKELTSRQRLLLRSTWASLGVLGELGSANYVVPVQQPPAATPSLATPTPETVLPPDVCPHGLQGRCRHGARCRRRHPEAGEAAALSARCAQAPCRWGRTCHTQHCLFWHPPRSQPRPSRPTWQRSTRLQGASREASNFAIPGSERGAAAEHLPSVGLPLDSGPLLETGLCAPLPGMGLMPPAPLDGLEPETDALARGAAWPAEAEGDPDITAMTRQVAAMVQDAADHRAAANLEAISGGRRRRRGP